MLGAGSWGTALAIQFARAGHPAVLWGHDPAAIATMASARRNVRYLPDAAFPPLLELTPDLTTAVTGADDVLVAVPSHALRGLLSALARLPLRRLAWATKGFEADTGLLPHQIAGQMLPASVPTAVLSGPTFAREVGAGLPTAMTIASADLDFAQRLAETISTDTFRAYTSTDIAGVEVGGATKNVYAIGAGIGAFIAIIGLHDAGVDALIVTERHRPEMAGVEAIDTSADGVQVSALLPKMARAMRANMGTLW